MSGSFCPLPERRERRISREARHSAMMAVMRNLLVCRTTLASPAASARSSLCLQLSSLRSTLCPLDVPLPIGVALPASSSLPFLYRSLCCSLCRFPRSSHVLSLQFRTHNSPSIFRIEFVIVEIPGFVGTEMGSAGNYVELEEGQSGGGVGKC